MTMMTTTTTSTPSVLSSSSNTTNTTASSRSNANHFVVLDYAGFYFHRWRGPPEPSSSEHRAPEIGQLLEHFPFFLAPSLSLSLLLHSSATTTEHDYDGTGYPEKLLVPDCLRGGRSQ